jgi:hypothetical protein
MIFDISAIERVSVSSSSPTSSSVDEVGEDVERDPDGISTSISIEFEIIGDVEWLTNDFPSLASPETFREVDFALSPPTPLNYVSSSGSPPRVCRDKQRVSCQSVAQ